MKSVRRIVLTPSPEQHQRLLALQRAFAEVCNALSPTVQQTRVWNRVALHHMAYRGLRERFPALGSQMVCNAIYSVARACRIVFQAPASPFHHTRLVGKPLPLLRFSAASPVYFDRHTLSLKSGVVSMYTLDGRMRFQVSVDPTVEHDFHHRKLQEVVLQRNAQAQFELVLHFGSLTNGQEEQSEAPELQTVTHPQQLHAAGLLKPEYLEIQEIT